MSILNKLKPEFHEKCEKLIENLSKKGVMVIPYSGYRTLEEQAILWRKGRPISSINNQVLQLRQKGCDFLADVIIKVGPQMDKKIVTNAIPGTSWHNWGYGLDLYASHNNDPKQPNWDSNHDHYKILAEEANNLNLTSGYYFSFRDAGHIQFYEKEVTNLFSLKQINERFRNE